MPLPSWRIAAALAATMVLAACSRPDGTSPYTLADAATRERTGTRATDAYPSSTPPPAETASPAPRADPLSREALSDSMITARVKTAIVSDPGMAGADVSVNTDSGVVRLTGTVKSQEQAAIASAHAQHNDGVMRIDNHLSPSPQ